MLKLGLDYGQRMVAVQNEDCREEVVKLSERYGEGGALLALSY